VLQTLRVYLGSYKKK